MRCGRPDDPDRFFEGSDIRARMEAGERCFDCAFWQEKVEWAEANDPRAVRVRNKRGRIEHYYIQNDVPGVDPAMRGFGGVRFAIKFKDGRQVETRNLWSQSTVPAHFEDRLPVNAEFVS